MLCELGRRNGQADNLALPCTPIEAPIAMTPTPSKGNAMCSPQWPAGTVNWRGGRMARMAGQRKTGQRKVRYGSPQQAAPASAQKKKKEKKHARKCSGTACHMREDGAGSFDDARPRPSAAERASIGGRCLGEREGLLGLVEARRGFVGPG